MSIRFSSLTAITVLPSGESNIERFSESSSLSKIDAVSEAFTVSGLAKIMPVENVLPFGLEKTSAKSSGVSAGCGQSTAAAFSIARAAAKKMANLIIEVLFIMRLTYAYLRSMLSLEIVESCPTKKPLGVAVINALCAPKANEPTSLLEFSSR